VDIRGTTVDRIHQHLLQVFNNWRIVNIGGGALARGHPIGASGAILAVRLFHGLQDGFGLAAIAAAGGLGSALVVARSAA
jgi:acetyl-CoA acetyltransferase